MKRFLILIAAAALMLPSVLSAQPRGDGGCGMGGGMQGMHPKRAMVERGMMRMGMRGPGGFLAMAEELQLTDQQKDKLKAMQSDFQLQSIDRRAAVEKAQIKLRGLMRDQAPAADVNRAIDEVTRLRADMQKAQYAHHQEMKGVLTTDQVKKLDQLRTERRDDMREHMREMRGMPGDDADEQDDGN